MSTASMVLHTTPAHDAHAVHKLAYALAYAVLMVAGTALLIMAFSRPDGLQMLGPDGQSITAAEVVMQSAAERALVSPTAAVLAATTELHERRVP